MRIPTNLGVPGSALRPSSFGGPFASFGQGQNPTSFIDTILQKERERMQAQADKAYQKAIELQKQSAMLEPPKMGGAIGKQDLLPMLLLAGIAKALGAQDRDLAEGLGGFVQGRQGVAQTNYQNDTARYDAERQRAEMDAKIAAMEADRQQGAADRFGGRLDKYEQRGWDAKQAEAADQRDYEREKLRQDALTGRALIRDPAKVELYKSYAKTPDGRAFLATLVHMGDVNALEASKVLSPLEQQQMANAKYTGTKDEGQALKNEWQKIANQFAAQGFQKKLDLTDAQIGLLQERTRMLPQTLAAEFGRLMVYKWAAEANAGDNAFDNQFKTWEAKNAPEIAGHKARAEALSKERSDIEATLPSLEGDAYNQATSRIAQIAEEQSRIRKRLSEIADSGPTFSGNAPMNPFQGMPNPFAQSGSAITPQGTKTTGPVAKPAKQPAATQRGNPKEPYGNTPRKNTPKATAKPKQKAKPNQAGTIDLGGGFKIGPKH